MRLGPDGSFYVLDLQARSVRRYGADGRYLATLGGPGPGPGEFLLPYALDVAEDTVRVFDLRAPRISAFSPDGELLDSHPVEPVPSSGWPVAFERLAPGGWLHLREWIPDRRRGEVEDDELVRSRARFVVWERASASWRTVLETAGGEARIQVRPGRGPSLVSAPYPARPLWRAAPRRGFWYLDSRRGPLLHLTRDGDTLVGVTTGSLDVPYVSVLSLER